MPKKIPGTMKPKNPAKEAVDKLKLQTKGFTQQDAGKLLKGDAKQKDLSGLGKRQLENRGKDLEAQDKLGNFDIQDLMSTYNQSETH